MIWLVGYTVNLSNFLDANLVADCKITGGNIESRRHVLIFSSQRKRSEIIKMSVMSIDMICFSLLIPPVQLQILCFPALGQGSRDDVCVIAVYFNRLLERQNRFQIFFPI